MVRGEDPGEGEEKKNSLQGAGGEGRRCAVAMRGVWRLLEYMKWKKGTDGAGGGGKEKKKKRERAEEARCCCRGRTKGASTFYPAIVGGEKKKKRKKTPMSASSR